MYYDINVSLNGRHFFATAPRSIDNLEKAQRVYDVFKIKFPESAGYKITVTRYETRCQSVALY